MDYLEKVRTTVKSVKTNSPILLMSDAVVLFKKIYSGPIKSVSNSDEVRELVSYYYGVKELSHPLIIEDLSNLSESASFLLLKLVEEATYPIILLSLYDKVSPILLSRCKSVLKFSLTDFSCNFLPAFKGKEAMDEYLSEDSSKMDQIRWMRDNSPMLFYYKTILKEVVNVDKMLNILM